MLALYFCLLINFLSFQCYASTQEALSPKEAQYKQALGGPEKEQEYQEYYNVSRNHFLEAYYPTLRGSFVNLEHEDIKPTIKDWIDREAYTRKKAFFDECTRLLGDNKRYQFLYECMKDKCIHDYVVKTAQQLKNKANAKEQKKVC